MAKAKDRKEKKAKRDKLVEIRERVKKAFDADRKNRTAAMEDLKFVNVPGEQWDQNTRNERGERPCMEFNKLRVTIKRVVNDMRANRPSGKVRGVEETDKDTAEVYEGLIRNIWNVSDADTVIDAAAEYQVTAGMGAWRITVDYSSDTAFEQDIRIEGIRNPFCLYADPACQDPLKRDARYWVLMSRISKTAYEQKYGNAEVVNFEADTQFDDDDEWEDEDSVRIVEYWYKEPVQRTVLLLADGRTIFADDPTAEESIALAPPVKSRDVMSHRIRMCIASGDAILQEAEWAGSEFPFIVVYGENMVIDGENRWFGLPRFAKDAQRAYNYSRTLAIETVALSPQAKWWATPKQALGHTDKWAEAHKKNFPFMLYNPDPEVPGEPKRIGGADVPVALIQEIGISSEDIKGVTGIYDASLGNRSNETSGVAIQARQEQGEIAVFNYMDNLAKGIRRTWEILIDLIPKIYDTERSARILGADGSEKYVRVNAGAIDLGRGKYDATVTVGPSFSTQRQEAAEIYSQMAANNPVLQQIAGDLMFKAMDLPYSNEIAERYKLMLPPQIQQGLESGKPMPPEVMNAMMQAQNAMQMVQEQGAMVQQAAMENEQKSAEIQKALSDLAVREANFKALVAEKMAAITTQEANLTANQTKAGTDAESQAVAQDRQSLAVEVQQATAEIKQLAAQFMVEASKVIAEIQARSQPQVVVADPPKKKIVQVRRVGPGLMQGEVIEDVA